MVTRLVGEGSYHRAGEAACVRNAICANYCPAFGNNLIIQRGREKTMYSKILVPVDLAHTDQMGKALNIAIDLAQKYNAALCYITITNTTPSAAAGNPKELEQKLDTFAR